MARNKKQGLTIRTGADDALRVYRVVTDIDALVVEDVPVGTKAKILRMEQQKAGLGDTHADARSQNDLAIDTIEQAASKGRPVRLESGGNVDISDRIDLSSTPPKRSQSSPGNAHTASSARTVGPAEKGFDESLGINAADLLRLMKEIIRESVKTRTKNTDGAE